MKFNENKLKFIQARAEGYSLKKTADKLGVSLSSCKKWEKTLKTEVEETRETMEEDLKRFYGLSRLAHLQTIGDTLLKIRSNVAARFESQAHEVPLAKMLEAQLKFEAMAMDLEAENKTTPATILAHLEKVKNGKAAAIDGETLEKIKAALNELTPKKAEPNKAPFVSLESIRAEAERMGIYG